MLSDCFDEKRYFPFDILGSKTSLVNMLSITCLLLRVDVGEGVFPSDGRWTEFAWEIFFPTTGGDFKVSLPETGGAVVKPILLNNSLDDVTACGLRLHFASPFCRDMLIAADKKDLAASAVGSDFVGVFLGPGASFFFSSLLSS